MRTITPKSGTGTNCGKLTGSVATGNNPAFHPTVAGPVAAPAAIRGGAQPNGVWL
jgi:hypothetical protein